MKFPGAYSASDPGILINIYTQLNSYTSEYFRENAVIIIIINLSQSPDLLLTELPHPPLPMVPRFSSQTREQRRTKVR